MAIPKQPKISGQTVAPKPKTPPRAVGGPMTPGGPTNLPPRGLSGPLTLGGPTNLPPQGRVLTPPGPTNLPRAGGGISGPITPQGPPNLPPPSATGGINGPVTPGGPTNLPPGLSGPFNPGGPAMGTGGPLYGDPKSIPGQFYGLAQFQQSQPQPQMWGDPQPPMMPPQAPPMQGNVFRPPQDAAMKQPQQPMGLGQGIRSPLEMQQAQQLSMQTPMPSSALAGKGYDFDASGYREKRATELAALPSGRRIIR